MVVLEPVKPHPGALVEVGWGLEVENLELDISAAQRRLRLAVVEQDSALMVETRAKPLGPVAFPTERHPFFR